MITVSEYTKRNTVAIVVHGVLLKAVLNSAPAFVEQG